MISKLGPFSTFQIDSTVGIGSKFSFAIYKDYRKSIDKESSSNILNSFSELNNEIINLKKYEFKSIVTIQNIQDENQL